MSDADSSPIVTDAPDQHRYEVRLDGELAGFAVYHRRGGRAYFVHTEIDPAFEGKGLGSPLARRARCRARTREPIVPLCPFIRSYIDRHPDTPTSSTTTCWLRSTAADPTPIHARVAELADAGGLNPPGGDTMRVRTPPRAPI